MRKTKRGGGGIWKPEVLLEENKGGEGGGLEMFLRRENRKNLRYFHMVPKLYKIDYVLSQKPFGMAFVPH